VSADVVPSWSRDGRWVYFASGRNGGWEVWKMPTAGGVATQVTRQEGYSAFESPDDRFLYCTKYPAIPGIWRMPLNDGEETEVILTLEPDYWGYWGIAEKRHLLAPHKQLYRSQQFFRQLFCEDSDGKGPQALGRGHGYIDSLDFLVQQLLGAR
jgi:hypothetical protein